MINIFKRSKTIALGTDEFLDKVDLGILTLKKGIGNYIDGNSTEFEHSLKSIVKLETEADAIQRKVENDFYLHALMPNYASDIMNLIEKVDDIIDQARDILSEFDVEKPGIPDEVKKDYLELASLSAHAAESVVSATRTFFISPDDVKDKIQKVLFYQRETGVYSNNLKRKVFQELDELQLSEKIHLRYFALHIERISDTAKIVAHLLSSLVIKIKM